MSFNVSPKETLTKCDYSNQFRQFPEAGNIAAANRAKALDVHETEAERSERLLMERFMKQNFSTDGDSYLFFIAKIGKILFLAVMLPPYMVCYGIPKWLITQAVTIISTVTNEGISMITKGIAKLNPWNADVFAIQFKRFLDAFSWRTKIADGVLSTFNDLKSLPRRLFNEIYKKLESVKEAYTWVKEKVSEKVSNVKEFIAEKYEKVSQLVQKQVTKANEWVQTQFEKAMAPGVATYEKIKAPIETAALFLKQKFDETSEKVKEKIEHVINKTIHRAEEVAQAISSASVQVLHTLYTQIEPYINWTYPIAPWVYNQSSIAVKYSIERIQEIIQTTQMYLQKVYEVGQKVAVWSSNQMQSLATLAYNKTVQFFMPFVKYSQKLAQAFKKLLRRRATRLHDFLERHLVRLKKLIDYFNRRGKQAANFLWKRVKTVPEKTLLFLSKTIGTIRSFFAWLLNTLKLTLIWTKVLFIYSTHLIRDLNREITGWRAPSQVE